MLDAINGGGTKHRHYYEVTGRWPQLVPFTPEHTIESNDAQNATFGGGAEKLYGLHGEFRHQYRIAEGALRDAMGHDEIPTEEIEARLDVENLLSCLDERERDIVTRRWLEGESYETAGKRWGITRAWAWQIGANALVKMRSYAEGCEGSA
jgi:DNA-directed RNA polymerase specialized sigma subunit